MPKIEITPSDDKTELTINIDGVALNANALQVGAIIGALAAAREHLLPAMPIDPPFGQHVSATSDPRYWTNVDPESGMTLLQFRHPGLGWLSFMLPPSERDRLSKYLDDQSKSSVIHDTGAPLPAMH